MSLNKETKLSGIVLVILGFKGFKYIERSEFN